MSRLAIRENAGYRPLVQRIIPIGPWDLLPNGHRVRGVNVIDAQDNISTPTHLADFWAQWPWTVDGTGSAATAIKPQIDAAKALGANTIRFFGTLMGRSGSGSVYSAPISTATYLAQWDQLLSYCRSQGLYVYPCLDGDTTAQDNGAYTAFTPTLPWRQGEYALLAGFFTKYADIIIGVDLVNECTTWASTAGQGFAVYQSTKAVAPYLRLTFSHDVHNVGAISSPWGAPVACKDFIDLHCYYDAGTTDFDSVISGSTRPCLLGEFGQNMAAGTPARQTHYNAVKAVVSNITSGRQVAGALAWSLCPQDIAGGTNDWGICDLTFTPRPDVTPIFSSFPN